MPARACGRSNQSLIEYLSQRAAEMLTNAEKTQPGANVISISQNDNENYCKSPEELAMIKADGSPMGPLLRAVNAIAKSLAPKFPRVAVDTLSYQYTQVPPTSGLKPEPNVIIRLCDISSNSGAPLTDPSNAAFAKVINNWFKLTSRIWIWNYVRPSVRPSVPRTVHQTNPSTVHVLTCAYRQ